LPYTAHYVVNTAQNGQGPLLNPHPTKQGIEFLCNPAGRGLGRAPTAATDPTYDGLRFAHTDAFLWTGVPGRSHNSNCYPGAAPAGVFDLNFALELAANASDQLGPPPPAVPLPVLGRSFDVKLVSGVVLVKVPGGAVADGSHAHTAQLTKGQGFVPLTQARSVPAGSEIDAREGVVQLTAASPRSHGKLQTGNFGGGLFRLSQDRRGVNKGLTTLAMLEGAFAGAPTYASCKAKKAGDSPSPAAFEALSSAVLQTLHGHAHGKFRTRGRYGSATVRGTVWTTIDRCDGTLTIVRRGTVKVQDFVRHLTVIVRAGHSYLARAPSAKHK
jgi:cellulase/cellobiase CelA1